MIRPFALGMSFPDPVSQDLGVNPPAAVENQNEVSCEPDVSIQQPFSEAALWFFSEDGRTGTAVVVGCHAIGHGCLHCIFDGGTGCRDLTRGNRRGAERTFCRSSHM